MEQLEELLTELGAINYEIDKASSVEERQTLENIYSNRIRHLSEAIAQLEQK
jgi:hypothetical protein